MKQIKTYYDFLNEKIKYNKLPDFEFTKKLKKIIIDINGEKIEALAGGNNVLADIDGTIEYDNTFYFKTDKENTNKLKKIGIIGVEFIDSDENIITFKTVSGESTYKFKVVWFSKQNMNNWEGEEDEYVSWKI